MLEGNGSQFISAARETFPIRGERDSGGLGVFRGGMNQPGAIGCQLLARHGHNEAKKLALLADLCARVEKRAQKALTPLGTGRRIRCRSFSTADQHVMTTGLSSSAT